MNVQKMLPILWLFAFLCSLFFFNEYELESFGLATIFLFSWSVLSFALKAEWSLPKSKILYFMAAFWLLAFISVVFSDILMTSLMAFVYFTALPLGFFIFILTAKEKYFLTIAKYAAVILGALGLWALCQYFFLTEQFGLRAHHPLKNPNSLAALFNFGLFGAVGWLLIAKTKLQSNLALILAILIIGGMVATVSRGAILAMIIMMIPMLFLFRDLVKRHWKCLSLLALSAVIFAVLASFNRSENYEIASRLLETVGTGGGYDTSHRLQLWAATWDMIKQYGLWGTGIGTYFQYFPEYRLLDDKFGTYYAHNDPLQYWVELGFLGPVLFYTLCVAILCRTTQAVSKCHDTQKKVKILVPFFALSAIVLHTHVTFNFYNLSILYMSSLTLAYWFLQTQEILQTPLKKITMPRAYSFPSRIIIIALPFLFIGAFFFAVIASENLTQKAKRHLVDGDFDSFAQTVITAQKVGMGHNYRADLLAVTMPITLLERAHDLGEGQRKEIFEQGLAYVRRAHAVNSRSASALYYFGLIQENVPTEFVPKDMKEPNEYYSEALRLDPLHFGARIKLSETLPASEALALLEAGTHYRYKNPQVVELYQALWSHYARAENAKKMSAMMKKIKHYQKFFHN